MCHAFEVASCESYPVLEFLLTASLRRRSEWWAKRPTVERGVGVAASSHKEGDGEANAPHLLVVCGVPIWIEQHQPVAPDEVETAAARLGGEKEAEEVAFWVVELLHHGGAPLDRAGAVQLATLPILLRVRERNGFMPADFKI